MRSGDINRCLKFLQEERKGVNLPDEVKPIKGFPSYWIDPNSGKVFRVKRDKVKEISENFKKDLKEHGFDEYNYSNKKYVTPEYIKWLKGAVAQCEGQLAKVKEEVDAETKKTVPVFKYLKDNCSRDEWISDKGSFTPEHKA